MLFGSLRAAVIALPRSPEPFVLPASAPVFAPRPTPWCWSRAFCLRVCYAGLPSDVETSARFAFTMGIFLVLWLSLIPVGRSVLSIRLAGNMIQLFRYHAG